MHNLTENLKKITVFSDLSTTELRQLSGYFQPFSCDAGTRIIAQATSHNGLYLILSGSVEVRLKIFGGGELSIAKLKAFDAFGEISLISRYPATANVIAEEAVSGLLLTPISMETISIIYPQLADKIKSAIALRCCQRSRLLLKHLPSKINHQHSWSEPIAMKKSFSPEISTFNMTDLNHFLKKPQLNPLPIPFFNALHQDEIDILNPWVKLGVVYRGDGVKYSSTDENGFYGLLWGAVQAVILGEHMIKVATYGPGDLFGTIEYIDRLPNPYRYVAREDAVYLFLNEKGMINIKKKLPALWGKIMRLLLASVGGQMSNINWIFLQLNIEDVYKVSQGKNHV